MKVNWMTFRGSRRRKIRGYQRRRCGQGHIALALSKNDNRYPTRQSMIGLSENERDVIKQLRQLCINNVIREWVLLQSRWFCFILI